VSNAWPSFPIPIKPNVPEIAVQVHLTLPLTQWLATTNLLAGHSHHGFRAYQTQVMPRQSFCISIPGIPQSTDSQGPICRDILCSIMFKRVGRWHGLRLTDVPAAATLSENRIDSNRAEA
jgi:hypothetical protein